MQRPSIWMVFIFFAFFRIPPTATIDSANVCLYHYYSNQSLFRDQNNHPAHIHRITRSWVEGTGTGTATNDGVSYQRYDGTYNWSTYGGDYAATALDTVTIYKSGAYGWKTRLNVRTCERVNV